MEIIGPGWSHENEMRSAAAHGCIGIRCNHCKLSNLIKSNKIGSVGSISPNVVVADVNPVQRDVDGGRALPVYKTSAVHSRLGAAQTRNKTGRAPATCEPVHW